MLKLDDRMNLVEGKKCVALTGHFLRAYSLGPASYAEKRLLPPGKVGIVTIQIWPERKDIHVME